MKKTVFENISEPYSLHDMNVIAFEVTENEIVMRTQSGIVRATPPYAQVGGYVEFHAVQWDFSYVYLLGVTGNVGTFTGEKMFLRDFIDQTPVFGFSIIDTTYGYNLVKYSGYISFERKHYECIFEIYHEGEMVFVEQ